MNIVYLPNLPLNSTNITGFPNTFNQATFFEASGFTANGLPIGFSGGSNIFLGVSTGVLPIVIPSGGSYTINANSLPAGQNTLSSYFVAPQSKNDGLYIIYG